MKKIELKATYLTLPNELYSIVAPYNNQTSTIAVLNKNLCNELSLDSHFLMSEKGVHFLSGSTNQFGPLFSQAYSGHQYGYFTTLGDGRAVMLGEVQKNGILYDLQLKGSGQTPYSRSGDGKATLYSMLREYLVSEAMHHLRIPTTRSLAVLTTNESILRMTRKQGGILVRSAKSHIRVGTFEFAHVNTNSTTVKELADYTINRHYKHLNNMQNKYQLFLREVIKNQALLISKWQSIGFVHGVMNTDNVTISGETIDYGPCAFLDRYEPNTSFSSIDQNARYSYKNQPFIGSWNLARFAESILVLLDDDMEKAVQIANQELQLFETYFKEAYYDIFGKKLGLIDPTEEEKVVIDELLLIMKKYKSDFTNTFRLLTLGEFRKLPFYETKDFTVWFQKWTRQLGYRKLDLKARIHMMEQHNPVLIPRNHLVEKALQDASEQNDFTLFHTLCEKYKDPYNYNLHHAESFLEPLDTDEPFVTYCGT